MDHNKKLTAWMPPAIWALVILIFTVIPGDSFPITAPGHLDKPVHFLVYAIFAVLLARGIGRTPGLFTDLGSFLFILILGGGYGILMELVQWSIPGRQPSITDALANVAGIIVGIALGRKMIWRK
ncbi:MAG: VanZ family protein [Candidatus Omnitrophota bacterium]|jgi:VanZ family protein